MNSLSAHMTAGTDHGRLRFHPDCPACRSQRLAGSLPGAQLPARAQAGLLAAALGAGTLLPGATASADLGEQRPVAETSQAPAPAPAPTPAPYGTQLEGDETQEAPRDEAPQLRELLTSPDVGTDSDGEDIGDEDDAAEPAPQAPLGEPAEPAPVQQPPVTAPDPQIPTPPPVAAPPTVPPVEPPPAAEVEMPPQPPAPRTSTKRTALKPPATLRRNRPPATKSNQAPTPVSPAPAAEVPPPTALPATVAVSRAEPPAEGPVTGRTYSVQPGDSLWSIAVRLLGGSPSAGRVAREVDRLWQLNRERINTGDPDMLHIGTELRLQ